METLNWPRAIPNWQEVIEDMRKTIEEHPELLDKAAELVTEYKNQRGLMIVDVVASPRRKYETRVKKILLPQYVNQAKDLSISTLASKAPSWMSLRRNEAKTMQEVAKALLNYGKSNQISNEESICKTWALDQNEYPKMLAVKGIGPALLEYLRMRCGANTLKVDVRVISELSDRGLPTNLFSEHGIYELCENIATEVGCTMAELDQVLWHYYEMKKAK